MNSSRNVPHDSAAETALLGSVLLDNGVLVRVTAIVCEEDFFEVGHRAIYKAMVALHARHDCIDHVTLAGRLADEGNLHAAGGLPALGKLTDTAMASHAESYARRIVACAVQRRVIIAAQGIAAQGMAGIMEDLDTYLNEARTLITNACDYAHADEGAVHISKQITEVANCSMDAPPKNLVLTGFPTLDRMSGGLMPGLLTVVAARPGMGKSAFAQNLATNAALAGKRVLFISLEDTNFFVGVRHLARFAHVDNTHISTRQINATERQVLLRVLTAAGEMPLWIYSGAGMTSERLRGIVLRHRERHGLDLLVVDHLAEIRDDAESETHVVSRAAEGARNLAKELNIPALYAHQLNRRVEDRVDKRPNLSDLKQSGKVEEVARSVWLLYRGGYYTKEDDRHDLQLIIAKANHGICTMVRFWADFSTMFIRDWEEATDGVFPQPNLEAGEPRKRATGARAPAGNGDNGGDKVRNWWDVDTIKWNRDYD
jgi:replicative DNA helicase